MCGMVNSVYLAARKLVAVMLIELISSAEFECSFLVDVLLGNFGKVQKMMATPFEEHQLTFVQLVCALYH